VAIKVTETIWHYFAIAVFYGKFAFPMCEHFVRRDWQARYSLRNFSCMVINSCMSVAVSGVEAEWLLGGNVLCNILMAPYRCFCRIVHGTYLSVPPHSNLCLSHLIGFQL